jgi:hypothetical protein
MLTFVYRGNFLRAGAEAASNFQGHPIDPASAPHYTKRHKLENFLTFPIHIYNNFKT